MPVLCILYVICQYHAPTNLNMCHLKTGLEPRVEYPSILFLEWITVLEQVVG